LVFVRNNSMAVKEISTSELKDMRSNKQGVAVIDVRTEHEFKEGHIENSKNIPMDIIQSKLQEIDWSKKVVFVCRSGARSRIVAQYFSNEGKDVYNLSRGIFEI